MSSKTLYENILELLSIQRETYFDSFIDEEKTECNEVEEDMWSCPACDSPLHWCLDSIEDSEGDLHLECRTCGYVDEFEDE